MTQDRRMTTEQNHPEQAQPDEDTNQRPPRSIAEKVTFGVASVILAIVVGLVCYVWLEPQSKSPPNITLMRPEPSRKVAQQFYVPFEIKNEGGETAESVQVLAELKVNGKVVESGEQQIDFLSGGETQEGAFVFTQNPEQGDLTIRVGSYKLP